MGYKWGALENTIGNLGNMGTHWEFGPELASSWFLQQLSSLLGLEFFLKKKTEDDLLVLGLENIFKN